MYFSGSDDELGMDDEVEDDSEPDFEPLEVPQGSIKNNSIIHHAINNICS